MKKPFALSALAVLICTAAIAQNDAVYQWAKNIGSTTDLENNL